MPNMPKRTREIKTEASATESTAEGPHDAIRPSYYIALRPEPIAAQGRGGGSP